MKTPSLLCALIIFSSSAMSQPEAEPADLYREAVLSTAKMSRNPEAQKLAREFELQILDLTWEDTGRFKDSAVGPNISDMTIQVAVDQPGSKERSIHCMPVIRYPNFSDKTADLDPEDFFLLVGNEKGQDLRRISLREFLENPTLYLHDPGSWSGEGIRSLVAPKRDSKVLVSAQACFLPIPAAGKATFNPVLFNYQSMTKDPAVLTILATREGTSVTVIDNTRDAFAEGSAWGQRLFFNADGERASLTGERESDFRETEPETKPTGEPSTKAAGEEGLNLVMLIQVPLKQRNPMSVKSDGFAFFEDNQAVLSEAAPGSDVENAVIGHGELEGPFTELDRLPIERDPRFPVRVTIQFYKATSNGVVSRSDLKEIKNQIDRVYAQSDFVGSLVTQGDTGRTTEYDGPKVQPADWWDKFWERHEENTGDNREEAIRKLEKLLGRKFRDRPVDDDYLHTLLESTTLPEGIEAPKKTLLEKLFGQ